MKVIGVIPARYKSSRFPGKPLADILGRPMIWWVYRQCLQVPGLDEIYVATDDERIRAACAGYRIPVVMTADTHQTGSDRVGEVAEKVEGDLFVNIQGDEPLIDPREVQQLIDLFRDPAVEFGSLRIAITDPAEIAADSTVKVVCDKKGDALYFSRNVIPSNKKGGPKARVFRHVGLYAYRRAFLRRFVAMEQTELELGEGIEPLRAMENGYKIRLGETTYESVGVDYPEHLALVEAELRRRGITAAPEE